MAGIDRKALIEVFERLDDALDGPQTICVIGAAAILGFGHTGRQTEDIDIWRPASSINDRALARAGKSAGLSIDDSELPDQIYLQIIRPGIVSLPLFADGLWATGEPNVRIWQGDKLSVDAAPAAVVAATKLARAHDRDLDDCVFLVRSKTTSLGSINRAIALIEDPEASRDASENMTLLEIITSRPKSGRETT